MADAMLDYRLNISDTADFALLNGGGVRATIPEGKVTRGQVLTAFPFGNALVEIPVTGEDIWKTLEGVYSEFNQFNQKPVLSKVQVSRNINITWNANNSNGTKLVDIKIANKPISNTTTYNVVTVDFLATGGDNIFQKKDGVVVLDTLDEILVQHIKSKSPIRAMIEGRIVNLNGTNTTTPTSSTLGGSSTPTRGSSGAARLTSNCLGIVFALVGVANLL
jgi:5'-nucleotidase